jgi:hypothetical protein
VKNPYTVVVAAYNPNAAVWAILLMALPFAQKSAMNLLPGSTKKGVGMSDLCGILFPYLHDVKDANGCIKPHAHNDAHVFKTEDGEYCEWQDDYTCTCGCWDEWEQYGEPVCCVYTILSTNPINNKQ